MVTANNNMATSYNQVAQINRQNHDWNRRHTTQEFLRGIIDYNLHDLNVNFNFTYRKDTIKMSEIEEKLKQDPSIKSKINDALNYYELVCVGLKNGVLDEVMVRDSIESAIKQTYRVFTEYIENMQKVTPKAFIILEQTATKWNAEDRTFQQRPHTA
jgi:Fe-S-cluster containining protein